MLEVERGFNVPNLKKMSEKYPPYLCSTGEMIRMGPCTIYLKLMSLFFFCSKALGKEEINCKIFTGKIGPMLF
jgi:hypothetical protein